MPSNSETGRIAVEYVMQLERAAGREPVDTRPSGEPYDITSPPRKIEVKASCGRPARRAAAVTTGH